MDVASWLKQLGFEQYTDSFLENEIDQEALATLTAEDLKDLGVKIIGHRRKLMNAIAALAKDSNSVSPSPQKNEQSTDSGHGVTSTDAPDATTQKKRSRASPLDCDVCRHGWFYGAVHPY